ncbi:MAG: hypothetical protein LRZ84_05180 [Desertifilum sp.]|nr:hypothetical protein [Desertifilum sp.]
MNRSRSETGIHIRLNAIAPQLAIALPQAAWAILKILTRLKQQKPDLRR